MRLAYIFGFFVILMSSNVMAETKVMKTQTMDIENCKKIIDKTMGDLGQSYNVIVNTDIMKLVKFPTADGDMMISCSGPDKKMTIYLTN